MPKLTQSQHLDVETKKLNGERGANLIPIGLKIQRQKNMEVHRFIANIITLLHKLDGCYRNPLGAHLQILTWNILLNSSWIREQMGLSSLFLPLEKSFRNYKEHISRALGKNRILILTSTSSNIGHKEAPSFELQLPED